MNTKADKSEQTSDFEDIIFKYSTRIKGEIGTVYFKNEIPEKKLDNAIKNYGDDIDAANVITLNDSTLFGNGKEGFIITKAGFYYKASFEKPVKINFSKLLDVDIEENRVPGKSKSDKIETELYINQTDQTFTIKINSSHINEQELYEFLCIVIDLNAEGKVDETDKIVILEDMPQDVKLNYLKAIIHCILSDNNEIDASSLSEIQTLMTQLNFDAELRQEVRSFIAEMKETAVYIEELLENMEQGVPKGSGEDALKVSLVKDVIRVNRVRFGSYSAYEFRNILELTNRYNIDDEQLGVIEQGIINDEKIMRGEVEDDQIINNAKELSSKASAVGIPIAAIYMSGSVAGLSAAGLTSGLAALGLGGILGLSSMVTGIGVVVIAGVGVYKGVKWVTSGSERSKTQKREFFIQEIIKNNQKTINNLAEDVNYFAEQVVDVTEQAELNKQKLHKLGRELTVFSQAIKTLQAKGVDLEEVLQRDG
ncbi:hypothetical protein [Salibacterium lacus]|uniref:Glycine zipper family protein n=1 Tax=Salibacterium lacus TaxID=1898109 RepID=A0ABW5T4N9_9BACI